MLASPASKDPHDGGSLGGGGGVLGADGSCGFGSIGSGPTGGSFVDMVLSIEMNPTSQQPQSSLRVASV